MVYTRTDGKECYLIALNPTAKKQTLTLDDNHTAAEPVLCFGKATYKPSKKGDRLTLPPVSALIVRLY